MHPNSSSPFPGETRYCLRIHPEVLCPFLRKLIFTHQCVQEAPLPFLGNFIAQHCIKEVLRPSMKNIFLLLTNSPRSASPFLGNFIAEHCIQEALRPSLETISIAHQYTQEAPRPFLGISLLNIASKRYAHHWKIFYCSPIHPRSFSPFLGKLSAQHCIQEVLFPSLENIFIAH